MSGITAQEHQLLCACVLHILTQLSMQKEGCAVYAALIDLCGATTGHSTGSHSPHGAPSVWCMDQYDPLPWFVGMRVKASDCPPPITSHADYPNSPVAKCQAVHAKLCYASSAPAFRNSTTAGCR